MNIKELDALKAIQEMYTSMKEATGREALAAAAKKHGFGTKERETELVKRGEEIAARNKRLDAEEAQRYGKKNEEVELDKSERSDKKAKIVSALDRIMAAAKANTDKQKVKKVVDERYDTDLDADKDGKLSAKDFKLLRDKKKKTEVTERYHDDEDDDVRRADAELKRMKVKLPKVKHKEVVIKRSKKDKEEELEEGFTPTEIKHACEIAKKHGGDMTGSTEEIEKIHKGLSNQSKVKRALRLANESVELDEARAKKPVIKTGDAMDDYWANSASGSYKKDIEDGKSKKILLPKTKVKEDLDEARSKPEMKVYHPSYSAAISHAEEHLNKQGYQIHPDDMWSNVSTGPSKPSEGKTTRVNIPLHKDGVPTNKTAHVQVYNRGNAIPDNMELNMYTSSTGRQKKLKEAANPDQIETQNSDSDIASHYHIGSIDSDQVPSNAINSSHSSHSEVIKKLSQHLAGSTLPSNIPCPDKGGVEQFSLNSKEADKNSINAQIAYDSTQGNPFKLSIWK